MFSARFIKVSSIRKLTLVVAMRTPPFNAIILLTQRIVNINFHIIFSPRALVFPAVQYNQFNMQKVEKYHNDTFQKSAVARLAPQYFDPSDPLK
jgi:hypothetical protein